MKFTAKREALLGALAFTAPAADRRPTMPILGNVCLRVDGGTLTVIGTNIQRTVSATCAVTEGKAGGITLPARDFLGIVKSLPDGASVRVEEAANSYAEITSGRTRVKLVALADREFPKVPQPPAMIEFDAASFCDALDATAYACCPDFTRKAIAGLALIQAGEAVAFVATDGHRLAFVEKSIGPRLPVEWSRIPTEHLAELRKVLDGAERAEFAFDHNGKADHAFFRVGTVTVAIALVLRDDSDHPLPPPPFQQVIPRDFDRTAIVDRAAALAACSRVVQLASDKTTGIKLSIGDDALSMTTDNPDKGEAADGCEAETRGAPLTIGMSGRYMIEALAHMNCERARVAMNGQLDPMLITPLDGSSKAVVMPMRL